MPCLSGQPLGEGGWVFAYPQFIACVSGTRCGEVLHRLVGGQVGHLAQVSDLHVGVLQNHLDHRVAAQGAVELVELLTAGRGHRQGDAQIIARLAGPQLNGAGVKGGVELLGHMGQRLHKPIHFGTHHLDGKQARVLDERVFARVVHGVRRGCGRSGHGLIIPLCRVFLGVYG